MSIALAHAILKELSAIRREGREMTYLRPDSKSQVTVEYDGQHRPVGVHTIVVSTQHDEFILPDENHTQAEADAAMQQRIEADVRSILLPRVRKVLPEAMRGLLDTEFKLLVNPTGKFVIGGPHGDTGLTGRKIIVDTYGGRGAHGGGAFSGKDPSKVDRSAAYAARHIAKNLVAAGIASRALVQVAYAIGQAEPVSLLVDTQGTARIDASDAEISAKVAEIFDMRPHAIEQRFGLRKPIYRATATWGHVGRTPRHTTLEFSSRYDAEPIRVDAELFAWEKLDYTDAIRKAFSL